MSLSKRLDQGPLKPGRLAVGAARIVGDMLSYVLYGVMWLLARIVRLVLWAFLIRPVNAIYVGLLDGWHIDMIDKLR